MNDSADAQILPRDPATRAGIGGSFASAVLPGAGQFFLGDRRQGGILFACFLAIAFCFWPLNVGLSYAGYLVTALAMLALFIVSSCLALKLARRDSKRPSWFWLLLIIPFSLIMATICNAAFLRGTGLRAYTLASSSMEPTLYKGDTVMTDLSAYKSRAPERGDLIVFQHKDTMLIKRLIGLPGDRISSDEGVITRNGIKLDEPYAVHGRQELDENMQTFSERVVPSGELFVLGDNRDASLDSRLGEFGELYAADLRGRVRYVVASKHDQSGRSFR